MPNLERLTPEELAQTIIDPSVQTVTKQIYKSNPRPSGVEVVKANVMSDDHGGHFMELIRLQDGLIKALQEKEINLDIKNGQANASTISPGTERLGHLHSLQDEIWIVANGMLIMGLYDVRKGSPTFGLKSKMVLTSGVGVFVPHGVSHSLANYSNEKTTLVYFASMHFSAEQDTQELRLIPADPNFWDFMRPERV